MCPGTIVVSRRHGFIVNSLSSEDAFRERRIDGAPPWTLVIRQPILSPRMTTGDDGFEGLEEMSFIASLGITAPARFKTLAGDCQGFRCHSAQTASGDRCCEAETWHDGAEAFALCGTPSLGNVPGRREPGIVVE